MNYVFVDIDHTLSHAAWRDHLAPTKSLDTEQTVEEQWNVYTAAAKDDAPVNVIVKLVERLNLVGYNIVALTARNERYREMTWDWLEKVGLSGKFGDLLMRPDDDRKMSSPDLKIELVRAYLGGRGDGPWQRHVAFVLDDRADVAKAFQAEGVTVLQTYVV